ncbi:class I SAM-dependent methyltransferase [Flaviflagellibacter deserti]|uniref:Class I SAM-dependent methyltransferase n=1 Tax=Flaviflagellibacter deserti TaxID=2267266 RepID=A0ABV9Z0L8_9HYPH
MLFEQLLASALTGAHLEIGTAAGGTLKEMMLIYPVAVRPKFVVVDPMTYFDDQMSIIEQNLRSSGIDPATVDFRRGYSWPLFQEALKAKDRFSFIFIDGHHGVKFVTQDLAWTRLLDVGGIVALHDHSKRFPGVLWSVRRFLKVNKNYEKIAETGALVILRKTASSPRPEVTSMDILLAALMKVPLNWKRSFDRRISRA